MVNYRSCILGCQQKAKENSDKVNVGFKRPKCTNENESVVFFLMRLGGL